MVSLICFTLAIILILGIFLFSNDFFNPASLYLFSQLMTLGFAYLKLNPLMTDFHLATWIAWGGSMLAFVSGTLIVQMLMNRNASKNVDRESVLNKFIHGYNWHVHFIFSFISLIFVGVGILAITLQVGTLPILSDDLSNIFSKKLTLGYYTYALASGPLPCFMFALASFKRLNPILWIRIVSRFMTVFSLAFALSGFTNRGTLFYVLFFIITVWNFSRARIGIIHFLFGLIFAIFLFLGIARMRSQVTDLESKYLVKSVTDLTYLYIANNYWNLDYAFSLPSDRDLRSSTWGLGFFSGFLEFAQVMGSMRIAYGWDGTFNESVEKKEGVNTIGYQWELYKDAGWSGIFLFPFVFGIFISWLYEKVKRDPTVRNIAIYSLFTYVLAMWFFDEYYKNPLYWMWGLFLFSVTTLSAYDFKEGFLFGRLNLRLDENNRPSNRSN